MYPALAEEVT